MTGGPAADPWLSERLGRPAWRLDGGDGAAVLAALAALPPGPCFAFARIAVADTPALVALQDRGMRVVDVTVTLEAEAEAIPGDAPAAGIRFAGPGDRAGIRALAERAFSLSRFHLDPAVAPGIADRMRADWVDGFFAGTRGSAMAVAESDGLHAGFVLLLGPADGVVTIDLIAVDRDARRRGIAAAMIRWAARALPGCRRLRVGTQAANLPSLRLYESLGFRVVATQYALHLHRP